ncbi:hypothetical protein ACSLVQ_30460, partial [Klebsiella pneumoniae]|uniref:hypothetical protein n=1 Tax=Klebsiella pneumoniae TaxID=573 RepID=UPI003EE35EA8
MTTVFRLPRLVLGGLAAWLSLAAAQAQTVLPAPEPPFKGRIAQTREESQPAWPDPVKAPAGAPNIVLVLL